MGIEGVIYVSACSAQDSCLVIKIENGPLLYMHAVDTHCVVDMHF